MRNGILDIFSAEESSNEQIQDRSILILFFDSRVSFEENLFLQNKLSTRSCIKTFLKGSSKE